MPGKLRFTTLEPPAKIILSASRILSPSFTDTFLSEVSLPQPVQVRYRKI